MVCTALKLDCSSEIDAHAENIFKFATTVDLKIMALTIHSTPYFSVIQRPQQYEMESMLISTRSCDTSTVKFTNIGSGSKNIDLYS